MIQPNVISYSGGVGVYEYVCKVLIEALIEYRHLKTFWYGKKATVKMDSE
jgi:hypothetical protein